MGAHGMSERLACKAPGFCRMTVRYKTTRGDDASLRERVKATARERRRFGYRRLHVLLRREGFEVNHKRLFRHNLRGTPDGPPPLVAASGRSGHGRLRAECLNANWFLRLADAAEKLEDRGNYYNEDRPHGAIGNKPPTSLQNPGGAPSPLP